MNNDFKQLFDKTYNKYEYQNISYNRDYYKEFTNINKFKIWNEDIKKPASVLDEAFELGGAL